jgi:hypothetical protein
MKADSPPFLDLRAITRRSDRCVTTVRFLDADGREGARWMLLGEAALSRQSSRSGGPWRLTAYLKDAVDFEHDSAYALDLPLVGVEFVGVSYKSTEIVAYVSPEAGADEDGRFATFHVPPPGYDPTKHPETVLCRDCENREQHVIVPEGFYQPKFEPELFEIVRGRCVTICFGPVLKDTEE